MPTYEYACKQCGEHIDVVQSFSDDPLTICPNCGGDLRKVFGSVGIVFKGSGFYKTDSRSSPKVGAGTGSKRDGDGSGSDSPVATKSEKAGSDHSAKQDGSKASSDSGASSSPASAGSGSGSSEKAAAAS